MTALDDRSTVTKRCPRCGIEKTLDDYYWNNTKNLPHDICIECNRIRNRESAAKRRKKTVDELDRVQQFVRRLRPFTELSDDEVRGSFIYDDNGIAISSDDLPKAIQTKFSTELSRRLNVMLREKSSRALEVIYDIIDSDLVEPDVRLKASQWWIERIIGKTPEKLELSLDNSPHETIFENVLGGSRDDHRAQAIGQAIDAEVVDIVDEDSQENIVAHSEVDELSDKNRMDQDSETNDSIQRHDFSDNRCDDQGLRDETTVEDVADLIVKKREEAKSLKKRIADQKRKRYAARAVGASSLALMPWLIDWRVCETGLMACLVPPSKLTPSKLEVIRSNDEATNDLKFILTQRANKAVRVAELAKKKLEGLKNGKA